MYSLVVKKNCNAVVETEISNKFCIRDFLQTSDSVIFTSWETQDLIYNRLPFLIMDLGSMDLLSVASE